LVLNIARSAWRLLPRDMRMRAGPLVGMASQLLMAPRLRFLQRPVRPDAITPGPVIVSGYLSEVNGIGRAGRLTLEAARNWDATVVAHDLGTDPGAYDVVRGSSGGIWLAHCNPPEAIAFMVGPTSHVWADRYRIGYWAYELELIPDEWVQALRLFHEIWAPSRFVADAIVAARGPQGPLVKVVPHPQPRRDDIVPDRARFGITAGFTALAMFDGRSTLARKNPMGAVLAFQRAFGPRDDAALIVKVVEGAADPRALGELQATTAGWPNIRFLSEKLTDHEVLQLIASVDALISLHRSEGFGLPIAEAMTLGVPAVVTGWSGSAEFADGGVVAVPYELVPAADPSRRYERPDLRWANPDLDAAAAALRRLAADPAWRAEIAAGARKLAAERLHRSIAIPHLSQFIAASGRPA
jgi:glycosyltransferase involved in cell wall biosynthesis